MGLKRRLEGRKQNLELFEGQAGEIQELRWGGTARQRTVHQSWAVPSDLGISLSHDAQLTNRDKLNCIRLLPRSVERIESGPEVAGR